MKATYFFSLSTNKDRWEMETQYFMKRVTWNDFIKFMYVLSFLKKTTIRCCESQGYNNQGTYITAGDGYQNPWKVEE